MSNEDKGINNLINIFSHSKPKLKKTGKNLEISDYLTLDYVIENLDDSFINASLNKGKDVSSLIIMDYLVDTDRGLKAEELMALSTEERICYTGKRIINKQVRMTSENKKKENGYCLFPKLYVELLCLTYTNLLKNSSLKPLVEQAKNRRDLKGILLIDETIRLFNIEKPEKIICDKSTINEKASTFLQFAYIEEETGRILQEVSQYSTKIPVVLNKKIDNKTISYVNNTLEDIDCRLNILNSLERDSMIIGYDNLTGKINKSCAACKESLESIYSVLRNKGTQLLESLKDFSHLIDKTPRWNLIRTHVLKDKLHSYHEQISLLNEVI